ncbi:MarR family winged helix-turn-helix transcriptional regulator [Burkholderia sp. 22PA0099]|uniref:MarR family winged helix-turn-helix transcriptional regulator n=1 Tax=unclassified Burkholderia TaxID=2613784 RepID=UPI0039C0218A
MSRSSESPIAPEPAHLAGDLRIALARLMRRLREQGRAGDFTSSQRSVLLRLERDGPSTVSALARAESVRPQSMRATVAALEAAGAVSGSPDPADGRQTLMQLTDTFRARLQASRAAREDWLGRALDARLSAAERRELAAAVALLQRLAED